MDEQLFPIFTLGHGQALDALVFGLVSLHFAAVTFWLAAIANDICKNGLNMPSGKLSARKRK